MSLRTKHLSAVLVVCGCVLFSLPGHTAPPAHPKAPGEDRPLVLQADPSPLAGIPADLRDPAFDRYVDLTHVGEALASQNAGLLTDLALQLAEGERILERPHKAMSASRVLKLAIRLAGEKKDKPTLDRLARVVKARGDKELADMLDKVQTLAAGARKPGPGWLEAVEQLDSETFVMLKSYLNRIGQAKLLGDARQLKALQDELQDAGVLGAQHKKAINERIADARASLAEKAPADAEVLGKLMQSSRTAYGGPLAGVFGAIPLKPWEKMSVNEKLTLLHGAVTGLYDDNNKMTIRVNALGKNPFWETPNGRRLGAQPYFDFYQDAKRGSTYYYKPVILIKAP